MTDPWKGKRLPSGVQWEPGALAALPSDWADRYAAGTPYEIYVRPHPDHPDVPVFAFRVATSLEGIITEGGSLVTEGGDVIYE